MKRSDYEELEPLLKSKSEAKVTTPLTIIKKVFCLFLMLFPGMDIRGQLISKANCQAIDSPKKQTNEFAFFDLKSSYVVKSNAVRSFFSRIYGALFCLRF